MINKTRFFFSIKVPKIYPASWQRKVKFLHMEVNKLFKMSR
jgi:hypothetical protein